MAKKSYPTYIGWYQPHDRSSDYTGELVHPVTGELYRPPSRTKQEFVGESDVNNILKQYKLTGVISHINEKASQGTYADLPDGIDFQESLHLVQNAQLAFASLPSVIRNRFGNDPAQFLDYMADPANQDEMIKLGLATDKRPPREAPNPEPDNSQQTRNQKRGAGAGGREGGASPPEGDA